MKKTTKGALAASAAGVLLLGGAGTLAFWNDTAGVAGGSLTAGSLSLDQTPTCDADWQLDSAGGTGGPLAGRAIVPGDSISKSCTYTLSAVGDHLEAALSLTGPADTALNGTNGAPGTALANALSSDSEFTISGPGIPGGTQNFHLGAPVNLQDGTYTVVSNLEISFPYGAVVDNSTQGGVASLDNFTLTVAQTDSH